MTELLEESMRASLEDVVRRTDVDRYRANHRLVLSAQPLHIFADTQAGNWAELAEEVEEKRDVKGDFFSPLPELQISLRGLVHAVVSQIETTGGVNIEAVLALEETIARHKTAVDDATEYYHPEEL